MKDMNELKDTCDVYVKENLELKMKLAKYSHLEKLDQFSGAGHLGGKSIENTETDDVPLRGSTSNPPIVPTPTGQAQDDVNLSVLRLVARNEAAQ
jgi:hypothetical protein